MASQRGGRGTSLGLLSGRLRGGFTASPIPRSRPSSRSTLETAGSSPFSPANSSASLTGDLIDINSLQDGNNASVTDVCTHLLSISNTLRVMQEKKNRSQGCVY